MESAVGEGGDDKAEMGGEVMDKVGEEVQLRTWRDKHGARWEEGRKG